MTTLRNAAAGGYTVTKAPLDVYISDINGNDANDGLTPGTAYKTILHAIDVYSGAIGLRAIFHIGRHGGTGYTNFFHVGFLIKANVYFIGDGAGQAGETGFTIIKAVAAAQAGSTVAQVVTGGGLGVNAYLGQTVEITSGAANGDRRTIRNNDANNIYPCRPFSAGFAPGDNYRVVEPDVVVMFNTADPDGQPQFLVQGVNTGSVAQAGQGFSVYLVNMKWTGPANSQYGIYGSRVVFAGIQCDTVVGNVQCPAHQWASSVIGLGEDAGGTALAAATPMMAGPVVDLGLPSNTSWLGWTLSQRNPACTGTGITLVGAHAHGSLVTNAMSVGAGGQFNCNGGNFFGGGSINPSVGAIQGGVIALTGPSAALPILITAAAPASAALQASSAGRIIALSNTVVTNTNGVALGSFSDGDIATILSTTTGTGSTFGCSAHTGGKMWFSSTAPTVLGPAGADITVDAAAGGGAGVAFAAATLAASGDFIGAVDGSVIGRR